MMNQRKIIILSICLLAVSWLPAVDFTVAPAGNDSASGTEAEPFASLERARLAVRELKRQQPDRQKPIIVRLRGGIYYLPKTLTFTPEDSGTSLAPVVYEAAPDEEPILSAGRAVTGWTKTSAGRWQAHLPEAKNGGWVFSQLYVNNQRRFRPVWPRQGYSYVAAASPVALNVCPNQFVYHPGDIKADWKRLSEIELCIIHSWNLSRFPIDSVDAASRTVTLSGRTWHSSLNNITPRNWYRLENVEEAFDQPGQWYLDRVSGTLSYIPLPGEDPATAHVVAPRHDTVISVKGDVATGTTVEHLVFRGITLAHNNWNVPTNGYSYAQAEAPVVGALTARNARHIRVDRCIVRHTGTYGIDFGNGCRDCTAEGCELFDLGAGGVKIGVAWDGEDDPRNFAYGCTVRNNLIAYGGRVHPAGVGVWIGHAATNRVEHNTIHDLYYSGVSVGWRWSFGPCAAQANVVEWNHIHKIGQGVLSDLGGIYMLGEQPGTVERFNHIHDLRRARYGAWGIYFDSGSSHIIAEKNLVYDTEDGGLIHGNRSKDNVVRNNILAFGEKTQLTVNTAEEGSPLRFESNIVCWQEGEVFLHPPGAGIQFSSNLYWRVVAPEKLDFAPNLSASQWKEREPEGIVADPCFTDLAARNFTLKAGSPANKIGFEPFDLSTAGWFVKQARTAVLPRPPEAYEPAPMELELPLREDFEALAVGQGLPGWQLAAGGRDELVQVTEATAAGGRRALRITDGLADYEPHIYAYPVRREGEVVFAFDLRVGVGAEPSFELRDVDPWYSTGPVIVIDKEGIMHGVHGKMLLKIPHDVWFHVELHVGVGEACNGRYEVRVRLPGGGDAQVFTDLPCSPGFKVLGWAGFCSSGTVGSVYDIDNMILTP